MLTLRLPGVHSNPARGRLWASAGLHLPVRIGWRARRRRFAASIGFAFSLLVATRRSASVPF
jgi:hypothetical protein